MRTLARAFQSALLAAALILPAAHAQAFDDAARGGAVAKAAELLRNRYIYPETGEKAAAKLEAQLAAGAYANLDPRPFAEKLTADIREIAHDKHLRVSAAGPAPPPPAGAAATPPQPPLRAEAGVVRTDMLAGQIGYIEVVGFPALAAFKPVIDRAAATLADAKAIVLDLRRNNGGSADGDAYLGSFFVDPKKKVQLNSVVSRKANTKEFSTEEFWASSVPTSLFGKPLYVLIGARTFSAGEAVAYDIQSLKLATFVGETTGGGANPGGTMPIAPQMAMFVPNGRAENPITKTNWEGVGVVPDISVPAADALKVALEKLGQKPESGDIDALSQVALFRPRSTPRAGSDTALRTMIESIAKGDPRYDLMTPQRQQVVRTDFDRLKRQFSDMGELKSLTFTNVDGQGMDTYDVKFANASWEWGILIDAEGKVASWGRRPAAATEEQRQAAFKAQDADGDGKLDKATYSRVLDVLGYANQLETLFAQRDVNKDGFVSVEEYKTPIPQ